MQKFIKRAGWKPLAYALLIKDDDKNIFFFRRQRKSTFLDQRELRTLILENTSHDTVRFDEYPITERESKSQLYIEIMRDNVDSRSIRNLFGVTLVSRERELRAKERADRNLKRDFLLDITTRIGDYERSAHESDTLGKIEEIIMKMNDDEIEHFLKQLMPKISNSIRKFLRL